MADDPTPAPTITDPQITALGKEAASAGDYYQVALCQRALDLLQPDSPIPDPNAVTKALSLTVAQARLQTALALPQVFD